MKLDIEALMQSGTNLPSPPDVAKQIIQLATHSELNADCLSDVISTDPALTSKFLRIVNSAMYATSKEVGSIKHAIVIMGTNAATSLALSFSLIDTMRHQIGGGLDYRLYWRRALLSGTAARVIGETVGEADLEELFLAGQLQDIGMLVLDKIEPGFYCGLNQGQYEQEKVILFEQKSYEVDHSYIGGLLLRKWNFPERTCLAVESSHDSLKLVNNVSVTKFVHCVGLSGHIADLFLNRNESMDHSRIAKVAYKCLQLEKKKIQEILKRMSVIIPDIESMFSTSLVRSGEIQGILEKASDVMVVRNLQAQKTIDDLQTATISLEARTRVLEDISRRDPLTGLYNRRHFEAVLAAYFEEAVNNGYPLSIAFLNLDNFKNVNDIYGYAAGDQVLMSAAHMIKRSLRNSDFIARYCGEEFVVILPDSAERVAVEICERIQNSFREQSHKLSQGWDVPLTISIGIATNTDGRQFENVGEMLNAADSAVYEAKDSGHDNCQVYLTKQMAPVARNLH